MIFLPIHILAGLTGIISGFVALYTVKGAKIHRKSGRIFVYAMLLVAFTGTLMGAILSEMAAVIPGVLAFYLVMTALRSVRYPVLKFHRTDLSLTLLALILGIASILYGFVAEGQPTALYIIFGVVTLLAALGDIRIMLGRSIHGKQRIVRHLWRMCLAMFIATGSFFLGQSDEFPEQFRNYSLLAIPVLLVLLTMFYWLVRVSFTQWYRRFQGQFLHDNSKVRLAAKLEH